MGWLVCLRSQGNTSPREALRGRNVSQRWISVSLRGTNASCKTFFFKSIFFLTTFINSLPRHIFVKKYGCRGTLTSCDTLIETPKPQDLELTNGSKEPLSWNQTRSTTPEATHHYTTQLYICQGLRSWGQFRKKQGFSWKKAKKKIFLCVFGVFQYSQMHNWANFFLFLKMAVKIAHTFDQ